MAKLFANGGDPDQTPCSAASDLGLHCLQSTLLQVSDYNGLMTWCSFCRLPGKWEKRASTEVRKEKKEVRENEWQSRNRRNLTCPIHQSTANTAGPLHHRTIHVCMYHVCMCSFLYEDADLFINIILPFSWYFFLFFHIICTTCIKYEVW